MLSRLVGGFEWYCSVSWASNSGLHSRIVVSKADGTREPGSSMILSPSAVTVTPKLANCSKMAVAFIGLHNYTVGNFTSKGLIVLVGSEVLSPLVRRALFASLLYRRIAFCSALGRQRLQRLPKLFFGWTGFTKCIPHCVRFLPFAGQYFRSLFLDLT